MDIRKPGSREVIALFPLGTVLLPGAGLPLHVFEQRYRQLLHDLEQRPAADRFFGVVAIRSGHEVGQGQVRSRYDVGTAAVVRDVEWRADGRAHVLAGGGQRFRLGAAVEGAPYDQAEVEWLAEDAYDDPGPDHADHPAPPHAEGLAERVAEQFARYRSAFGATEPPGLPDDPRVLSWAVAAAMVLDLPDRQALLELPGTADRLRAERRLLHRENALLRQLPSRPAVELPRENASPN
jgi:Lon protease-like protein